MSDCGIEGSEKNESRGSRRLPRTFTPALHVRKDLHRADVDRGVGQQAAVEDEPAAFDVELARERQVLAVLHLQFAAWRASARRARCVR